MPQTARHKRKAATRTLSFTRFPVDGGFFLLDDRNFRDFMCIHGLQARFEIPDSAQRLWITVSRQPLSRESLRFQRRSNDGQRFDGRLTYFGVPTYWQLRHVWRALGQDEGTDIDCYLTAYYA